MIIYQYINVHIYVWGGTIIKVLYEQCVDAHICMCQTYNILYEHCIEMHIFVYSSRHITNTYLNPGYLSTQWFLDMSQYLYISFIVNTEVEIVFF